MAEVNYAEIELPFSKFEGAVPADKLEITRNLYAVNDPEIGISIVDLGLIYDVAVDGDSVAVKMTLTVSGCPLADYLVGQVRDALIASKFTTADVQLVWDPQWSPALISEAARKRLGY